MLTMKNILQARKNIRPYVSSTPLEHSRRLSDLFETPLYLKLENFRELRSFKVRGAVNFIVSRYSSCQEHGVVAASGGSHALGVAYAALKTRVPATIVMTERAPQNLKAIVESYGAKVEISGEVYDDAAQRAADIARDTQALFIDSFNDPHIMAGQGTIALELLEQEPDLEAVVCPVGGGGLLAGVSTAVKTLSPNCAVYGVEPESANAMYRSFEKNALAEVAHPRSIADKLVTKKTGDLTFQAARPHTDAVFCVSEEAIEEAVYTFLAEAGLLIEGAGAIPLALVKSKQAPLYGKKTALILTGGNIDPAVLFTILAKKNR